MKNLAFKLLSGLYWSLYHLWVLSYSLGLRTSYKAKVPVISIGNLSVGGTGKTPTVDWLLGIVEDKGYKVGLVSRGYGREKESGTLILDENNNTGGPCRFGDEAWLLHLRHPKTVVAINRCRDHAAQSIEDQVDLIVMDDGFQHWRLARDMDWVLMDALAGVENTSLLPSGRMREPAKALGRADVLLITKCNWGNPDSVEQWAQPKLQRGTPVFHLEYLPTSLIEVGGAGSVKDIKSLRGESVLGLCGIGNPLSFRHSLEALGVEVVELLILSDHQTYGQVLIDQCINKAAGLGVSKIICTEKDAVKLSTLQAPVGLIEYLRMEIKAPLHLVQFVEEALDQLCE